MGWRKVNGTILLSLTIQSPSTQSQRFLLHRALAGTPVEIKEEFLCCLKALHTYLGHITFVGVSQITVIVYPFNLLLSWWQEPYLSFLYHQYMYQLSHSKCWRNAVDLNWISVFRETRVGTSKLTATFVLALPLIHGILYMTISSRVHWGKQQRPVESE